MFWLCCSRRWRITPSAPIRPTHYQSLIVFGKIRIVEARAAKQRFCEVLMTKYGKPDTTRPKGFFPRLDAITVYAITVERMTGKEMALPPLSEQWPAIDRTKTPNAQP